MELRDITRSGDQNATLSPSRVGSTRYLLSQDIPWFGKRDLKREVAELEGEGATGKALGTWSDIAARIKTAYAQWYYVHRNERLTREILDLMPAPRESRAGALQRRPRRAAGRHSCAGRADPAAQRTGDPGKPSNITCTRRLNALLARPPEAELAEPERTAAAAGARQARYATLAERVRARNPLLAAEESKLKAAEKSRELAYRNRYPDFTIGFGPIQYQSAVKEWEVMVEMNIPLQQSSRRAQERESEAMLAAARSRREASTQPGARRTGREPCRHRGGASDRSRWRRTICSPRPT
jgi:cobalt-zinc-cadmium efflux system outer membrane protein